MAELTPEQLRWNDWRELKSMLSNLETTMQNIKKQIEGLESFKVNVFDNVDRKAMLKTLIDLDPDYSINQIVSQYQDYKTVYDWLITNGY